MPRFERNSNNNRGTNGSSSSSSTSRLAQFYPDSNNNCGCTLSLSLWKKYVIFSMAFELPENEKTETNKYDYDNTVQVMISPIQILSLKKGITAMRKEGSKIHNCVAFCKDDLLLKITDGKEYGYNNWAISIIDRQSSNKDRCDYIFNLPSDQNDLGIFYNFDEKKDSYKTKDLDLLELDWFLQVLDCALEGMTTAHSNGAIAFINNALNRIMSSLDVIKGMLESAFANRGRSSSSDTSSTGSSRRGFNSARRSSSGSSNSSAVPSRRGLNNPRTSSASLDDDDDSNEPTDVEEVSMDELKGILSEDDED